MRRIITSIILLLSISVNAQVLDNNLKVSVDLFEVPEPLQVSYSYWHPYPHQANDHKGGRIIDDFRLIHFDQNFTIIDSIKVFKLVPGNRMSIFSTDKKVHILTKKMDKKKQEISYKIYSSPIEKLNFHENKVIAKINYSKFEGTPDHYYLSRNSKLFAFRIISKEKKYSTVHISLFDNNINHIFTQKVTEKDAVPFNYVLDEKNKCIFLLYRIKLERKERKKRGGHYKLRLYKLSDAGFHKLDIYPDDKVIRNVSAAINASGKFVITGFYGDELKGTNGFVYFDIDKDNMKINFSKYTPYTQQFYIEKFGKVKKRHNASPVVRNCYLMNNNETILFAEEVYYQLFEDIIIAKFAPDGTVQWTKSIAKKEETRGFYDYADVSFSSTVVDSKIYLLLNATVLKKHKRRGFVFRANLINTFKKPRLYVIEMDLNNGDWKYKLLFDGKKKDIEIHTFIDHNIETYKIFYALGKNRSFLMPSMYLAKIKFGEN